MFLLAPSHVALVLPSMPSQLPLLPPYELMQLPHVALLQSRLNALLSDLQVLQQPWLLFQLVLLQLQQHVQL